MRPQSTRTKSLEAARCNAPSLKSLATTLLAVAWFMSSKSAISHRLGSQHASVCSGCSFWSCSSSKSTLSPACARCSSTLNPAASCNKFKAAALAQRMYDSSGRALGRVDAERFYSASGQQIGRVDGERVYDGSGRQLGRIDGDRVYNASGRQIGRIDGDRLYSASGSQMGRIDGERLYDGSGRQIGRADGLRRMQMIVFFYFFM